MQRTGTSAEMVLSDVWWLYLRWFYLTFGGFISGGWRLILLIVAVVVLLIIAAVVIVVVAVMIKR